MSNNWKSVTQKNASAYKKIETDAGTMYEGPLDMLIVSPVGRDGASPYFIHLLKSQLSKEGPSVVLRKFIKEFKVPGYERGWAFTFNKNGWYQIDNTGTPNSMPLNIFLQDEDTIAFLKDRNIVKSLTFKEALYGPNITMAQAMKNSTEWTESEMSGSLDDIPTSDAFNNIAGPSSEESNGEGSSSDPVTPVRTVGGKRKAR